MEKAKIILQDILSSLEVDQKVSDIRTCVIGLRLPRFAAASYL